MEWGGSDQQIASIFLMMVTMVASVDGDDGDDGYDDDGGGDCELQSI